jgi:hypothetical protein
MAKHTMNPVIINGYLWWVDGNLLWDAERRSYTYYQAHITRNEYDQMRRCLNWDAYRERAEQFAKKYYPHIN